MSGADGGSAFPIVETTVHMTVSGDSGYVPVSDVHSAGGMALRDYFAAKAMQGMLANSYYAAQIANSETSGDIGKAAYFHADAMLAARATGAAP